MSAIPLKNVFVLVLFYKSLKDADWRIRKAAELAKTVSLNDCHIAGEGEAVACISFHSDLSSDQLKDHFEPEEGADGVPSF